MRRALNTALLLIVILIETTASPSGPTTAAKTGSAPFHNVRLIHGLYVALPEAMSSFPDDIVPLP